MRHFTLVLPNVSCRDSLSYAAAGGILAGAVAAVLVMHLKFAPAYMVLMAVPFVVLLVRYESWRRAVGAGVCLVVSAVIASGCVFHLARLPLPEFMALLYPIGLIIVMLLPMAGSLGLAFVRGRPIVQDGGKCWACGFDVSGSPAALCPECATPATYVRRPSVSHWLRRRGRISLAIASMAVAVVLACVYKAPPEPQPMLGDHIAVRSALFFFDFEEWDDLTDEDRIVMARNDVACWPWCYADVAHRYEIPGHDGMVIVRCEGIRPDGVPLVQFRIEYLTPAGSTYGTIVPAVEFMGSERDVLRERGLTPELLQALLDEIDRSTWRPAALIRPSALRRIDIDRFYDVDPDAS